MYQPLASRLSNAVGGSATGRAEWFGQYDDNGDSDGDLNYISVVDGQHAAMELFDHPLIENTSHQYSSAELFACHSDEKPLWWLVLRWMKMMLFKISRTYHAKPLLLMVAPLFLGILLGFGIGKWQSRSRQARPKQIEQITTNKQQSRSGERKQKRQLRHLFWIGKLAEFLSVCWYHISLALTFSFSRDGSTSCAKEPTIRETFTAKIQAHPVVGGKNTIPAVSNSEKLVLGDDSDKLRAGLWTKENETRSHLKSDAGTQRESDVPSELVPRHIAVIMDGNRRYGKSKYGSVAKGHWDGSSKLVEFAKWCIAEQIAVLTVFAFSSENWKRDPAEIASLMQIFAKYCDELRVEAIERNIKIMVLSTDYEKIPRQVRIGVKRMVNETQHCDGMIMNICLSYGSRGEIVGATKSVIEDVLQKRLDPKNIDEKTIEERLLTYNRGGDPDVLIRTSGEVRISNFLLWQLAYTEFFFLDKPWPAIEKNDLLDVIQSYAKSRNRRYGT